MAGRVQPTRRESSKTEGELADIIRLDRYPLHRPESPECRRLAEAAKSSLSASGAFVLEGFLPSSAVAGILDQADSMAEAAFVSSQPHNVFLQPADPAFPSDHARNRLVRSEKSVLADDQISAGSPLRQLYGADCFRSFLCEVLEVEGLFPFEDPLAPINVSFYGEGEELGWHFDNSPFAVTLLLRDAAGGGAFEYVPDSRRDTPEGYAAISRVLDGDQSSVRELQQGRGALVLFKGARSLHRVTPCGGPVPRTIAILSYASEPGRSLKEHTRLLFYGRTQ
jgi:alkylated DNA repair dioxygenase AlkB